MPSGSRNPESAVIDQISALVESQLRQESSGYDHNINQADCEWCGDCWHGLKSESTGCPGAYATEEELQEWFDQICSSLQELSGFLTQQFNVGWLDDMVNAVQEFIEQLFAPFSTVFETINELFGLTPAGDETRQLSVANIANAYGVPVELVTGTTASVGPFELTESAGREAPPI